MPRWNQQTPMRHEAPAPDRKRTPPAPTTAGQDIEWQWLAAIFALALAVRMIVLWQLSQNSPSFDLPQVDSKWHYLWAQEIAKGNWLGDGVFYRAPLYPYLLGIWFKIAGDGVWPARIVQALMGSATAALVFIAGRTAFTRRIGIIAGIAWALYGPMIYYETEFLIPVLIIPINLIALILAMRTSGHPQRIWTWFGIGLLLGVSAIARPNILLTIPAFWYWSWLKKPDTPKLTAPRWSSALALTVALFLPIAPVTVHNWYVGGDPVLIAYQGGVNLYLGNNPQADGVTMMMPDLRLDETVGWNEFVGKTDSVAEAQAGRELRPSEVSAHWTGKAIDYMLANPGETVGRWLKKTYYLLNGYEVGDQTNIYRHTDYSSLLSMLIRDVGVLYFPFGLVAALSFIGVPTAWRDRFRTRPLMVFTILYAGTVVPFLATARHRLPFVVVMVILAAVGALNLWSWWQKKSWLNLSVGAAVVVTLIVALNLSTTRNLMYNPAFDLYQQALLRDKRGEYYDAIELYEEAIRVEPRHLPSRKNLVADLIRVAEHDSAIAAGFGYMRIKDDDAEIMDLMGRAYLGRGDTAKAKASFRIAAQTNPHDPRPQFHLGEIAEAEGVIADAVGRYRAAILADSTFTVAYNNLAMMYAKGANYDQASYLLRACVRHVPDHGTSWANLGAVLLEGAKPAEAIAPLKHAIELMPELVQLRFNLAVAYLRSEDGATAEAELRKLLEIIPDHPQANELLNRILEVKEDHLRGSGTP